MTTGTRPRRVDQLLRVVGLALLVVVAVFPFAATGLLAPLWAVAAAWVIWAVTAVVTWRVGRRRPQLTPLIPLVAASAWYLALTAAATAFDWSP